MLCRHALAVPALLLLPFAGPAHSQSPCLDPAIPLAAPIGYDVAFGDLDEDGWPDLVVGSAWGSQVLVRLATGPLAFGSPVAVASCTENDPVGLVDLDLDGHLDLVVRRIHNSFELGHHTGDGSGALGAYQSLELGSGTRSVFPADVDGDGHDDVVVSAQGVQASVHLSRIGGPQAFAGGVWAVRTEHVLAVEDMDLDGAPDLVVTDGASLQVLRCDANQGLLGTDVLPLPPGVSSLHGLRRSVPTDDLDLDGLPDLLVGSDQGLVLVRSGGGSWGAELILPTPVVVNDVQVVDLDRDGFPDVLTTRGQGTFGWTRTRLGEVLDHQDIPTSVSWNQSVTPQDLDLDGTPDLVILGHTTGLELRRSCTTLQDCDGDTVADGLQMHLDPAQDWNGDWVLDACVSPITCTSNPNSTGAVASLEMLGSPVLSDADLTLSASGLPPGMWSYFLMARNTDVVPLFGGSQGVLCLANPIVRLNVPMTGQLALIPSSGDRTLDLDSTTLPSGTVLVTGESWTFQLWFRDVNPSPTSNTTNGFTVLFR